MANVENYLVIVGTSVVNVIIWDGETPVTYPDGTLLIPQGDSGAGPRWSYVDGEFIAPPVDPEESA